MDGWVKDSVFGGKFDFGICVHVRKNIIRRRKAITRKEFTNRSVDEYHFFSPYKDYVVSLNRHDGL